MKHTSAFTFVELIVVITILAFLATIGFISYRKYLASGYDTNRLVQLRDIHDGLERMSVTSKLPFPEDMIQLTASGSLYAYQGNVWSTVINTIGYDGGGKDPEFDNPFIYMLLKWWRDFQLMWFIQQANLLTWTNKAYAETIHYASLFPKVVGKPLWILLEKWTQTPIHLANSLISNNAYDIISWPWDVLAYISDKTFLDRSKTSLAKLYPNSSCERILELGEVKGNGEYILELVSWKKIKVYCDMETDGGWWTYVAHSSDSHSAWNFWWLYKRGNYDKYTDVYSLWPDVKEIYFDEILFQTYQENGDVEAKWKQVWFDNTVLMTEESWEVDAPSVCKVFAPAQGWGTPPCFEHWWDIGNTSGFLLKRAQDSGFHGIRYDGLTSNGGVINEMRWDQVQLLIR